MKNRKSSLSPQTNAIVIILISLFLIILILSFIQRNFGESKMRIEELVASVPEPPKPTASEPISASQEQIKTKQGEVEVIKFAVFNPTGKDWIFRDALSDGKCGDDTDLICFIDSSDTSGICDNYQNAKANDLDCKEVDFEKELCCVGEGCGDNEICLISNIGDCKKRSDPDCGPKGGIQLSLACDDKLTEKNFQYNTKAIKAGEYDVFTALIEIRKDVIEGRYLCQINVLGGTNKYTKDLIFEVE